MFNINFHTLIDDLLPWFLTKPVMLAWLQALLSPVVSLYDSFLSLRDVKLYEARYNGQVAELEYVLNDFYYADGTTSLIYIEDNTESGEIYLYNISENEEETYIYNLDETTEPEVFIFNSSEAAGTSDFTIFVPGTLVYDTDYLSSLVRKYKIAGPTFTIQHY
ncbi:MAG: hypothetical protein CVT94_13470 [Bacteroidetes bacterium HGW-Bacteroidetes-11]|jgi:hypothetical protein|nr:MAG: hypothetical protein CVT94_13470 [Bacteroidetes bacterium HGW-Bacteroidetes-11]